MRYPEGLEHTPGGQQTELPDFSKIEIPEKEATESLAQVLDLEEALDGIEKEAAPHRDYRERHEFRSRAQLELFDGISAEEAARLLKAVSNKSTGTRETPMFGHAPSFGDPEEEGYMNRDERDPELLNTFDTNNGTLDWIDNEGIRWVAPACGTTLRLADRTGLRQQSHHVSHSNDSGMWMQYHNRLRQELDLRDSEEMLKRGRFSGEWAREVLEKEIRDIREGAYTPATYRKKLEEGREHSADLREKERGEGTV